jgi:hypothetical protein
METYYLAYPLAYECDDVTILTTDQYTQDDLPANHHFESVTVGNGGEFATIEDLETDVAAQNEERSGWRHV